MGKSLPIKSSDRTNRLLPRWQQSSTVSKLSDFPELAAVVNMPILAVYDLGIQASVETGYDIYQSVY
jgi:hypothetical protein